MADFDEFKHIMADIAEDYLSVEAKAEDVGCCDCFKRSTKRHKKLYFFVNLSLKVAAFISFVVIWNGKFNDFINRPEYESVCEYVISKDLDYHSDLNCTITVDNKNFTCDTEFGNRPSYNDTDGYSYKAESAKEFANDISLDYMKLLFYLWIGFNCLFKLNHNYHSYRSKILRVVPKCSFWKKLKVIIYENLIEISVGTAIYPITYPDYGDCFDCDKEWACSHDFFTFSTVGFWIVLFILLLSMNKTTSRCLYGCICGICESKNIICYICISIPIYCMIAFIALAVSITQIDLLTSIYSSVQLSISAIYYFLLLFYEDVDDGAIQLITA